jgi:hypothetical protein
MSKREAADGAKGSRGANDPGGAKRSSQAGWAPPTDQQRGRGPAKGSELDF